MSSAGRPEYEPTQTDREQVSQMLYVGMTRQEIASVLGISVPTLRKNFRNELKAGASLKRSQVVAGLFKLGNQGNVQALKKLEEMGRLADAAAGKAAAEPPQGKKARQNARASAIARSPRFSALRPPQLAVVGGRAKAGGDDTE